MDLILEPLFHVVHTVRGALMTFGVMIIGLGVILFGLTRMLGGKGALGSKVMFAGLIAMALGMFLPERAPTAGHTSIVNISNGIKAGRSTTASIRSRFGDRDEVFEFSKNDPNGHAYIALNSLGRSNLSPEQIMRRIYKDPGVVFPLPARGRDGQQLELGNVYQLKSPIGTENPVKVVKKTPFYFTFEALKGHLLEGSATHGIVKDDTGELWLFQLGAGVSNEDGSLQDFNYGTAKVLWRNMAANTRRLMNTM